MLTDQQKYCIRRIKLIGKILIVCYAVKAWYDGDGISFTWRVWNPIAWLFIIPSISFVILLYGITELSDGANGFTLSKYWKERKNERVFISPLDILRRK